MTAILLVDGNAAQRVEQHGGEVSFAGAGPRRTRISFTLPR
jgi:hypothetical protein